MEDDGRHQGAIKVECREGKDGKEGSVGGREGGRVGGRKGGREGGKNCRQLRGNEVGGRLEMKKGYGGMAVNDCGRAENYCGRAEGEERGKVRE
jgi:hypothetical protein